jgi:hypothetical protein
MATKTEELLDKSIALYIAVDQYADNYYDEVVALYRRTIKRISRILKPEYGTKLSVKQKSAIKTEIADELVDYRKVLENKAQKEIRDAVDVFYEQEEKLLGEVVSDISLAERPDLARGLFSVYHAIDKGKVIQLDAMYASHISLLTADVEDAVNRLGAVVEDKDVAQGYFTAATNRNQNILNAVAVTSILLASSRMRQLFYSRNKRLFDGYQWVSILDNKTTDYCQFRHLKVWYYNDRKASTLPAEEHPPGHFRCRSRTVPILKGESPVQSPTFEEWFENQDTALQKQVLGPSRYEMYLSGTLDIGDLNNIRGERRTLDELRALL